MDSVTLTSAAVGAEGLLLAVIGFFLAYMQFTLKRYIKSDDAWKTAVDIKFAAMSKDLIDVDKQLLAHRGICDSKFSTQMDVNNLGHMVRKIEARLIKMEAKQEIQRNTTRD